MNFQWRSSRFRLITTILLLFIVGCAQQQTGIITSSPINGTKPVIDTPAPEPTDTPVLPSPTQEPTVTLTLTPTPLPTGTSTPMPVLGFVDDGISAWCLPEDTSIRTVENLLNPPVNARLANILNGELEVNNLPSSVCVFLYHFNMPAPQGITLEVYDQNLDSPWLTSELIPLKDNPQVAAVVLNHAYITAPPFWNIGYQFSVKDSQGSELRRDQVNLHRWVPERCWNGNLPNVFTLTCPLQQDLHPWDTGYGTPMPTAPPED
jgi:hypothetical protein